MKYHLHPASNFAELPMQRITFSLDPSRDHVELNQLLKLTGLCDSGGAGKAMVASGAVMVDGSVELRKTRKVRAGEIVSTGDVEIHVGRD
jgi:ribosome-associated protein